MATLCGAEGIVHVCLSRMVDFLLQLIIELIYVSKEVRREGSGNVVLHVLLDFGRALVV